LGAVIFETALDYRPAELDRVEVYPAEDGQCLYQVYKRERKPGYWVIRYACKYARLMGNEDATNPLPVERQGLWDSEEKAQAECFWLKEVSRGKAAVGYEKVLVNRTTGYERRHMKGLYDPTAQIAKGQLSTARARYTMAETQDLTELSEWRCGDRRLIDGVSRCREMLETLAAIDSRLRALEARFNALGEGTVGRNISIAGS
jgi:hypothetical protein